MTIANETTEVLVVGGGLVGLATAVFLGELGVRTVLVDRHAGASIQGRARGINQRTMELYRAVGLEAEIRAAGRPFADDWGVARCETLAGDWHWLFADDAPKAWPDLSPSEFCQADQSAIEPILIAAGRTRGTSYRFGTELVSLTQDEDRATAVLGDLATGANSTVEARYVVAADGQRSPIREQLGIPRTGPGVVQHSASIVFRADLAPYVPRRALFWIIANDAVGAGLVTTAEPGRWSLNVAYDPAAGQSLEDFTTERAIAAVRAAVGVPDLAVEIEDVAGWQQTIGLADRYRAGRVFLAGDAAHTWPPAGAMGANTGVQDGHNLAWKVAGVLRGWAGERLLDSYEAERRTVAAELSDLIVKRQLKRIGTTVEDDTTDDQLWTLGQRYRSDAVAGADHTTVFGDTLDRTVRPGCRAPHVWIDNQISTHDLFGRGYVLFAPTDPQPWLDAIRQVQPTLPVEAYRIGTEPRWSSYGPSPLVSLIRPDGYVAWTGTDPEHLAGVMPSLLALDR
ncbi:FAD-dependent monooxygenase [Kribbella karoonensis]|uniref:FAD-dependent monooxygenase n=1 Tax=Kribbella karoonensis TaxID=324851 RepID=UPI0031D63CC4